MSPCFITKLLIIIDQYMKLVLSSWPAVILIIGLFIIFRHKEVINNLINRIESVNRNGVKFHSPEKEELAKKLKTDPDLINMEKIIIENGEVAIGVSQDRSVRFVPIIRSPFFENTIIELIDNNDVIYDRITFSLGQTGIKETVPTELALKIPKLTELKVRVRSNSGEKTYGPVLIL